MEEKSIPDPLLSESESASEPVWSPPQISLLGLFGLMTLAAALFFFVYAFVLELTVTATQNCPRSTRLRAIVLETVLFLLVLCLAVFGQPAAA